MRIDMNPVAAWKPAPGTARFTAVTLYLLALGFIVFGVARGIDSILWFILASLVPAYLATDTSLMVMRGRKSGVVLGTALLAAGAGFAVWGAYSNITAGSFTFLDAAALAASGVWLAGIVALFTPSSKAWRAENGTPLMADVQRGRAKKRRSAN